MEASQLSEIVGSDLPSFLSFHSTGGGTWAVTSCWNDVVRLDYFSQRSGQTYPDGIFRSSGCDVCECHVPLPKEVRIGEARHMSSLGEIRMELTRIKMRARQRVVSIMAQPERLEYREALSRYNSRLSRFFYWQYLRRDGDCIVVFNPIFPVYTRYVRYSCLSFVVLLCDLLLVVGQVAFDWELVFGSRVFSRACLLNLRMERSCSTEKSEDNSIFFTKEQFNARLQFPLPSLFREFFHFTQIPPTYIHPNMVQVLMGCIILAMLFNLDLTLLEAWIKGEAGEWNLCSVTQEPQPYVLNILPRRLPKKVVAGEHFVLKDFPFYVAMRKGMLGHAKARLNNREVKMQEGLLRKAPSGNAPRPPPPAGAPAKKKKKKEITIREPEHPVLPSISSGSGRLVGLNHSGPSMSMAGRLALLAEEATSINQSDSPHPDADEAGTSYAATLPPSAPPTEEMETESQVWPHRAASGSLLETIEVSCSSVQEDHPEGSETEMAEENPAAPVLVPDRGSPGETQPAKNDGAPDPKEESLSNASCCYAFSKNVRSGGSAGERYLRHCLTTLSAAREDNEALRIELAEVKSREESTDARLHEVEDEMTQLRGEVRQLRTEVSIEKKQRENLQLRLSVQKEELEAEFAAKMEELEADYQKQVDEMVFFGYRCCMKKYGIKRDVLSIPPVRRPFVYNFTSINKTYLFKLCFDLSFFHW
ncbi:hypothetical protein CK203_073390 [Vitis vinifera]|uniref:Uncharacterized protein n=1 Tax=Vitis vinifera TaxID=29760 RepID=A0A438ESJ0_VITVI|nr:hypothetical protein CK203_073390 [Vitis vinifera]